MRTPVIKFKTHITYADNSKPPRWSVYGRQAWLGSGLIDKCGQEIFEGDIVYVADGFISKSGEYLNWERNKAFYRLGEIVLVNERDWAHWQTAGCIPASQISMHPVIVSDTPPTKINMYTSSMR